MVPFTSPAVVPAAILILPAGSELGIGVIPWTVGVAGMDVIVVVGGRGVELGAGVAVDPTDVGLVGVCSRPIWNVPRQAVMTRKRTTANKMRDFMEPPDLDLASILKLLENRILSICGEAAYTQNANFSRISDRIWFTS